MVVQIGEKIKELRHQHQLSLSELSAKIGVSKQSIHRYENGVKSPSTSTLLQISNAFNVHPSHFFADDPFGVTIDGVEFRQEEAMSGQSEEIKNNIIQTCKQYLHGLFELKGLLDEKFEFDNPIKNLVIQSKKDIEKAAKSLRKAWKLGTAPIRDVTSLIEGKGLAVIEVKSSDKFTGLMGYANKEIPFIVINKNIRDTTRKRFTLLHELGHIVLNFEESIKKNKGIVEALCNHFAGAILLVGDILSVELGKNRTKVSLSELKFLKEKYGASIQSILIRAQAIGYITRERYDAWVKSYDDWYGKSVSSDFGIYKSHERPVVFNSWVIRSLREQRITWERAAELNNTYIDVLRNKLRELEFTVE